MGKQVLKAELPEELPAELPDAEPVETETVRYVRVGEDAVSRIVTTGTGDPGPLPEGAVEITEAEHAAAVEEFAAAHDDYVGQLQAEEAEQREGDYAALRALGVPEATARRLTGHVEVPA